ncbi:hypothetical protein CR513_45456, partial [Mucuna pruriens]
MAVSFESFTLLHVPRDQNKMVDLLTKLVGTKRRGQPRSVIHENLSALTVDKQEVHCNETRKTWMDSLIAYLKEERLLEDSTIAKRMLREASRYVLIGQRLYRRGFSFPPAQAYVGSAINQILGKGEQKGSLFQELHTATRTKRPE